MFSLIKNITSPPGILSRILANIEYRIGHKTHRFWSLISLEQWYLGEWFTTYLKALEIYYILITKGWGINSFVLEIHAFQKLHFTSVNMFLRNAGCRIGRQRNFRLFEKSISELLQFTRWMDDGWMPMDADAFLWCSM